MNGSTLFKARWALAALVVLAVIVGGCEFPGAGGGGHGSVRISIGAGDAAARTFQPGNTGVTAYRIYGIGPNDSTVDETVGVVGSIVVDNLRTGYWRFDVDALNSELVPLFTDAAPSVLVQSAQTTDVDVTLTQISGNGTINLSFQWPDGAVTVPDVSAVLTPYVGGVLGTPVTLVHADFTAGSAAGVTTYAYSGSLAAGYYLLEPSVYDGATRLYGPTDTVRIFRALTTEVLLSLDSGSVQITITVDRQDPLAVTVAALPATPVAPGAEVVVSSTVTGGTEVYSYQWYLNGAVLAGQTGPSVTLNTAGVPLPVGRHDVSLVAFDGVVLGSDWVAIDVVE